MDEDALNLVARNADTDASLRLLAECLLIVERLSLYEATQSPPELAVALVPGDLSGIGKRLFQLPTLSVPAYGRSPCFRGHLMHTTHPVRKARAHLAKVVRERREALLHLAGDHVNLCCAQNKESRPGGRSMK